jgi:putative phage-type endonuclease
MKKVMKANVLMSKVGMTEEEWNNARRLGIGGSDAGAILGLNPYFSALQVYLDKRGQLPEKEDTEAMRLGRDLEEYVAQRFVQEMAKRGEPKKVKNCNFVLQHPEYPWMLANVDRLIVGENAVLECKTASAFNKTDFEDGNIPEQYYAQAMHYLAVLGAQCVYMCILQFGKEPFIFKIDRNEEDIKTLIAVEKSFWEDCVIRGVEPAVDGTIGSRTALSILHPEGKEDLEIDVSPFTHNIREIVRINAQIKDLEAEAEKHRQEIQQYMRDATVGTSYFYRVTWRNSVRNLFDTARFKKDYPELAKKYIRTTNSRNFYIKEI